MFSSWLCDCEQIGRSRLCEIRVIHIIPNCSDLPGSSTIGTLWMCLAHVLHTSRHLRPAFSVKDMSASGPNYTLSSLELLNADGTGVVISIVDHWHIFCVCLVQGLSECSGWLSVISYCNTGGSALLGSTSSVHNAGGSALLGSTTSWTPVAIPRNTTA